MTDCLDTENLSGIHLSGIVDSSYTVSVGPDDHRKNLENIQKAMDYDRWLPKGSPTLVFTSQYFIGHRSN
jgi:hypothetical protein